MLENLEQFKKDYPKYISRPWSLPLANGDDNLFIVRLKNVGFTEEDIDKIAGVLTDVCPKCFDNHSRCHCSSGE